MAKILVIDDEDDVRGMIHNILELNGHQVKEARNGREGLAINKKTPFDLVITDIVMPEEDGIETIMNLLKSSPKLKIIAISGGGYFGPDSYLKTAHLLGAHATLNKPFNVEKLLSTVDSVLETE